MELMTGTDIAPNRRQTLCGLGATSVALLLASKTRLAHAASSDREAAVIEELVTANRILANQSIVDAFGHVSRRHPERPEHFLMSRARAPGLIEASDIMEFDRNGVPVNAQGRHPYLERFIHAAVYEARPDVNSVIHDHSPGVIPFSVSSQPLRPLWHGGGALGGEVPIWDIRNKFGDKTNLLVANMDIGRDLARRLGKGAAVLMRGHGAVLAAPSIRLATFLAIGIDQQARLQTAAHELGEVNYLTPGEIEATGAILDPNAPGDAIGRTWEYWCKQADRPYVAQGY